MITSHGISEVSPPPFGEAREKHDKSKWFKTCFNVYFVVFFFVSQGEPMKQLIWNKHTKLVLKHVAGWFCIVTGVIMLITPGQGLLTILIGVFLLADHVPTFGRLRDWLHHKFPKTADYVHHQGETLRARFHRTNKP